MATELTKSLEELTDEEREALADRVFTAEFYEAADAVMEAAQAVRTAVTERPDQLTWPRDAVIAALNGSEHTRLLMHVVVSLGSRNLTAARNRLAKAGCAYCDEWKYDDQDFEIPVDRALTEEEIAAVDDRVKTAIRAHIQTCTGHPMRELERRLAAALAAAEGAGV